MRIEIDRSRNNEIFENKRLKRFQALKERGMELCGEKKKLEYEFDNLLVEKLTLKDGKLEYVEIWELK